MRRVRDYMSTWRLLPVSLICVVLGAGGSSAASLPQSTYIRDVQIDMTTLRRLADESDNFHLTWHSDGDLYGAYGDGWGFVPSNTPSGRSG